MAYKISKSDIDAIGDIVSKYDVTPLGTKKNWVTETGGLPLFVRAIAHALMRNGQPKSMAIRNALGSVKRWARGGGNVTVKTRAKAVKAVAEFEGKAKLARATGAAKRAAKDVKSETSKGVMRVGGMNPSVFANPKVFDGSYTSHDWVKNRKRKHVLDRLRKRKRRHSVDKKRVHSAEGARYYKLPIGAEIGGRKQAAHIDRGHITEAADRLERGHKVELDTVKDAHTLVTELGKRAEEAQKAGKDAKPIDMCKVSVKGTNLFCTESKGIPRKHMPQLSGVPTPGTAADKLPKNGKGEVDLAPGFRKLLKTKKVKTTTETVPAASLRASQNQLNGTKVAGIMDGMEAGKVPKARIFVSQDGYVIDGHHRWAAEVGLDTKDGHLGDVDMDIERIDMPILDVLDLANKYSVEQGIPQAGVGAKVPKDKKVAKLDASFRYRDLVPPCIGCQ